MRKPTTELLVCLILCSVYIQCGHSQEETTVVPDGDHLETKSSGTNNPSSSGGRDGPSKNGKGHSFQRGHPHGPPPPEKVKEFMHRCAAEGGDRVFSLMESEKNYNFRALRDKIRALFESKEAFKAFRTCLRKNRPQPPNKGQE